ncbi:hypothetical protein J5289_28800 (plasmid) [Rhizobium sp. B230/85]|uniref:condensation domain-containing protein n=1 Tax=unclassified Rhizobium TaxID=2613769 RepID=UPI001ADCFFF0|nr:MULTISPECIES: condensation domain-containing protein [unclassified Rhizobium]MBO9136231.1 hypothetical protein [Rhizobium sp. B209b/85]QXZ99917.1 hypothetical protein J5289_28800 [Rhizobium sp. B230/85]
MNADRQTLLRQRLASAGLGGAAKGDGIPRRADPRQAVLSSAQQQTWLYQQAFPGSVSNNLGLVITFNGQVDENRIAAAVDCIVERHEILRTTYHGGPDGVAYQHIRQSMRVPKSFANVTGEEAVALAKASLLTPFDLETEAPLRLLFFRTGVDEIMFALVVHHIIWDGATFDLFSKELERAYEAGAATLPALPVHYADIAEWDRHRQPRIADDDREYWIRRLAAPRPPKTLRTNTGDIAADLESAGRVDYRLASPLDLTRLAASHRVTPFIAFLACWAAVLGRKDTDEVTVGTTVLTRDHIEAENLIGNFANHIVLRLPVGSASASRTLIRAAAAEFEAGFAHRNVPYETVVEGLGGQEIAAPPDLFDSLVVFIPSGTEGPRLPGIATRWQRLHNDATQFPLVPLGLEVFVRGRGAQTVIDVEATYARNAFCRETITELLSQLDNTIRDAVQEVW